MQPQYDYFTTLAVLLESPTVATSVAKISNTRTDAISRRGIFVAPQQAALQFLSIDREVTLRFFSALPAPGWGLWKVVRYVFLGEKAIATMFGRFISAACPTSALSAMSIPCCE